MRYRFNYHLNAPQKGDLPFTPQWYIYTTHGAKTELGHAVTPTDSIEPDIDEQIDKLIDELNEIRKELKEKLKSLS